MKYVLVLVSFWLMHCSFYQNAENGIIALLVYYYADVFFDGFASQFYIAKNIIA